MKEEETHFGPSPNRIPTTSDLKIWATELGFDALGVADIDLSKQKKSVSTGLGPVSLVRCIT